MTRTVTLLLAGLGLMAGAALAAPPPAKPVTCPVMKGKVDDPAHAPKLMVNNVPVYFCCGGCDAKLKQDPAKYLTADVKDPVTGKPFKVTAKTPKVEQGGGLFLFATDQTKATFLKNPAKYSKPQHG